MKNNIIPTLVIISFLVAPAMGVSVSYIAVDGSEAVLSSTGLALDKSTSLTGSAVIDSGNIVQSQQVSGEGSNSVTQTTASDSYSISSSVSSDGALDTSSSTIATPDAAVGSQHVEMSGDQGTISSSANSAENSMALDGGFTGENNLNADLAYGAADGSVVGGSVDIGGADMLSPEDSAIAASGDVVKSVDAFYATPDMSRMSEAGMQIANVQASTDAQLAAGSGPLSTGLQAGSNPAAYALAGWRWNRANPKIQMQVNSWVPAAGLTPQSVQSAVNAAEATWNTASSQVLFNPAGASITNAPARTRDNQNSIAFRPVSGSALAMTTTWYNYAQVGGKYSALESDMVVNSNYKWTTDLATSQRNFYTFDVQSVVLHELGHTLGLKDLYNLNDWRRSDRQEVMNSYNDPQRKLGAGDTNGLWQLYH